MTENTDEMELKDRLSLIESMIAEGRRATESWGSILIVWGVAFYVAFAWATLGHSSWAWPVTMIGAFLLTRVIHARRRGSQPRTAMSRAIGSIWIAMGISMFILFPAIGISGRMVDPRVFAAIVATMLGTSNAASSMALKWKLQFVCALIWWAAAAVACFGSVLEGSIAFLIANFFCQILFGLYGIICEFRQSKKVAVHA